MICKYNCLIILLAVLSTLVEDVFSVDKSKFKSCDQSSFCRRCRQMPVGRSVYELDLDVFHFKNEFLSVMLINTENQVKFNLHIMALQDSSIRVRVEEADPLRQRYQPTVVLEGQPIPDKWKLISKTDKAAEIQFGEHRIVLQAIPFRLDVYTDKSLVISLNPRGLFRFEHTRHKPGEEEGERLKTEQEEGQWEENFSSHHDNKPYGPTAIALDISFPGAKVAYGLPEHADSLHLRTTIKEDPYRFYNLDVFEYDLDSTMSLYASVPVIFAHSEEKTVGAFWLNPSETWVDTVTSSSDVVNSLVNFVSGGSSSHQVDAHFMSESGDVDLFLFLGPRPLDVARQYIRLVGLPPIPPIFSIGYHQCRWNYMNEEDVNSVHLNFDLHQIPVDVIWLDIEHTDGKKYFTWDPYKFSHPLEMQQNLTVRGRKLVVIVDPHIKRESGYFLHDDATNNGYYVKNKDSNDYEGWCWPGSSSYLDFMNPNVEDYYASRYRLDLYAGSTEDLHLWNDMNEPSVFNGPEVTMPKDNIHHGGWEHREIHNLYGLYHVMGTYKGMLYRNTSLTIEESKRPFILTRSAFSGSQRYTAIWTGDNMAEWTHLKASYPMCLSLALVGFSFCGADVGGFFRNPSTELLIRWYQAGAFLPFYRAHAHIDAKRREPWLFGEEVTDHIRNAVSMRYAYLPLWYTLFYSLNTTGAPVIRPLFMEFPEDSQVFKIQDQLLVGDSLLVKPVTDAGASKISVYFPGENTFWYDVSSYQLYTHGTHVIPVTLSSVPVFQRGGAIVPLKLRRRRSTRAMEMDPYTLVVTPDQNGEAEGELYIDDGTTHRFRYRKDSSVLIHFDFVKNKLTSRLVGDNRYKTPAWLERVIIAAAKPGFTGATLTSSEGSTELGVRYEENGSVVVRKPGLTVAQEWSISLH